MPTHPLARFACCLAVFAVWGAPAGDAQAAPAPFPRAHDRIEWVYWELVFRSIRDQTRKPVIGPFIPAGSFCKPRGVRMTASQVMEAIRAALLAHEQPCLLIERERMFILVPADEKVDPA
jgi:hypothetical protein